MGILILAGSALLYFLLSSKIDYWTTLAILGFRSESPQAYIDRPSGYNLINILLGILVVALPFFGGVEIYFGVIVWLIVWLASGRVGRNKAYSKYRQIMLEMIDLADHEDEKKQYRSLADKTNEQMAELVKKNIKLGM